MVILSIILLLLSNAVTTRRDKSILYSKKTIIILIYCIVINFNSLDVIYQSGGIVLFGGLFYLSSITQTFNIFMFIVACLIIQLTGFYPRKVWHNDITKPITMLTSKFNYNNTNIISKMSDTYKIIEYPLILLFIITGGILLISSSDIVSIFLSIELQSYGLYLLCTLYRNSESSTTGGLTYFLLGALSSTFILLGSCLLYINFGTTNLDAYFIIGNISEYYINSNLDLTNDKSLIFNISLLIMLVGFLFKLSAAPFHFWSPDVYDAIPTIVTTFVAIIAKISIGIFLLGLVHHTVSLNVSNNFNWKFGLLLSSFLSLIIGTILGLTQTRIKRLLAYSTISHLGFILLALSINTLESNEAFMFYLITYTFSNLNLFLILIAIGYSFYTYNYTGPLKKIINLLSDRNYSPVQLIVQLKGYCVSYPTLSLSIIITLFSLVGIPPLIGFFAKQMVLSAALNNGYITLSIVAILTSVISAAYYLNVIKLIYFDSFDHERLKAFEIINFKGVLQNNINNEKFQIVNFNYNNIALTSFISITISILTLIILTFMFQPVNLLNIIQILGLISINT